MASQDDGSPYNKALNDHRITHPSLVTDSGRHAFQKAHPPLSQRDLHAAMESSLGIGFFTLFTSPTPQSR